MATAAQITANQANAARSTGPRTDEGKAASARNNTSHGLCSKDFVILEGQQQEFDEFITALRDQIRPSGALEFELFAQHAHAAWGLRRCRRAEVACQADPVCRGRDPLLAGDLAERLKRIDLYTRRAERTFQRTLKELKALQTIRFREHLQDAELGVIPDRPTLVDHLDVLPQVRNHLKHAAIAAVSARRAKAAEEAAQSGAPNPLSSIFENLRDRMAAGQSE